MKDINRLSTDLKNLRTRAEKRVTPDGKDDIARMSIDDILRLVYDLETHQIELEMQNEDMREIQNQLIETRDQYTELYDLAPIGYLTISNKGIIIKANLTLVEMLGVSRSELIMQPLSNFILKDDQDIFYIHLRRVLEIQQRQRCELRFSTQSGDSWWGRLDSINIESTDNKSSTIRLSLSNISAAKLAEMNIIATKQEAEYANNAKSDFLARMSHELRTPMNAILGFGQLLDLENENLTDEQKEWVNYIPSSGNHLLELIDEVLDISKIDANEIDANIQAILLDETLKSVVLLVQPLAVKRKIAIQMPPETSLSVRADRQRLKQVLINLLSNGVKYNHEGGEIRISVVSLPGELVRINVIDNGYGIREEDKARIFEPFHRVSDIRENIEGTGIGLTITKRLVEVMDGRIGFESEYNKGSTFWIELHLADDTEEQFVDEPKINPENHATSQPKTILYIEDNNANLMMMQQFIKQVSTSELLMATNAEEGIDIAKLQQPDLILMDIDLPGMDGFEALDILQADERTSHIPVIAISAHATRGHVKKYESSNFTTYLTKPINLDKLLSLIS